MPESGSPQSIIYDDEVRKLIPGLTELGVEVKSFEKGFGQEVNVEGAFRHTSDDLSKQIYTGLEASKKLVEATLGALGDTIDAFANKTAAASKDHVKAENEATDQAGFLGGGRRG